MSFCIFFFFKQKTAYEMRISDWSSDVCSSDLLRPSEVSEREIVHTQLRVMVNQLVHEIIDTAVQTSTAKTPKPKPASPPMAQRPAATPAAAPDRKSVV